MTTYAGSGLPIANVFIGTTQAKRMMLGDKIIWMPAPPAGTPQVGGVFDATTEFKTPGTFTYTIPMWANKIDVVVVGGGMAGFNGTMGNGSGGNAGKWADETLTLESLPTTTLTLAVIVGAGGRQPGGLGTLSKVTGVGINALAAPATTATNMIDVVGKSPGNHTFNGKTYTGGAAQTKLNNAGIAPGGGGGAGGFMSAGGAGAAGAVWIRAYQKF
jgi:hypothetical protein